MAPMKAAVFVDKNRIVLDALVRITTPVVHPPTRWCDESGDHALSITPLTAGTPSSCNARSYMLWRL